MHTYIRGCNFTNEPGWGYFQHTRHSRKIKMPAVLGTWHSTGRKTDRGALVEGVAKESWMDIRKCVTGGRNTNL